MPDGEGGWLIGGVGRSEPEPSIEDQGPRGERLTLRISADGEPRDDFGDGGILHKTVVIGRAHDELITDQLERVTESGEVHADLLVDRGSTASTWTDVFAIEESTVVAVTEFGRDLRFQTFAVEGSPPSILFRPLRPLLPSGADPNPGLSLDVCVSTSPCAFPGVELDEGRLYVLRQPYQSPFGDESRLIAVDPRRWQLVPSFGENGLAPLPGLVDAPVAFAVEPGGRVVVAGAVSLGSLPGGLRVLRFSRDGSADADFGGTVHREARDVPGADQVVVDDEGRALVLEAGGASLVRLTPAGRVDPAFGDGGFVDLARVDVCGLAPGSLAEACTER